MKINRGNMWGLVVLVCSVGAAFGLFMKNRESENNQINRHNETERSIQESETTTSKVIREEHSLTQESINHGFDEIKKELENLNKLDENIEDFFVKILGENYKQTLNDSITRENLVRALQGHTVKEIIQNLENAKKLQIDIPSSELRNEVLRLMSNFKIAQAIEVVEKFIDEHPNLNSKGLAILHTSKILNYIILNETVKAEETALMVINLSKELNLKCVIIETFLTYGLMNSAFRTAFRVSESITKENKTNQIYGKFSLLMAQSASRVGNIEIAKKSIEDAIFANKKYLKKDHSRISASYLTKAYLYLNIDRSISKKNFNAVIEIEEKFPERWQRKLDASLGLIRIQKIEGDIEKALSRALDLERDYYSKLSDQPELAALTYLNIAELYSYKSDFKSADEYFSKTNKVIPKNNKYILGKFFVLMGDSLVLRLDYLGAINLFKKSLGLFKQVLPPNAPEIRELLERISSIERKL